jgi:eukaryotic-like serine/threonine-protein kinase
MWKLGSLMTTELQFDGCEVLRKLRSGPATNWYLGKQRSLGRTVVIKALSPNVAPESPFAAPLEREAHLLAQLHHDSIIQLYDFVRRPKSMWLVLEFVDGWPLDELKERLQRLSVPAALAVILKLLDALQYVHEHGIIHRDIQPKNITITRSGELKLSNFFLAAEANSPPPPELLEGDSGFAALSYMSPEQVLGESTDPSSDLFSVGVLLYEMVTGIRPFDAEDSRSTAQRIRHEAPQPLTRFLPEPPPILERILLRALQKLPADRFADTKEMRAVIEQALTQYGSPDPKTLIAEALNQAGLHEAQRPPSIRPLTKPLAEHRDPVSSAVRVYSAALAALVCGSAAIHAFAGAPDAPRTTVARSLPLAPKNPALLRVVCSPWANVFVDGQLVAVTPFAEPIPLSAGVHYVRLEHPNARPEQRELRVAAGQRVLLDVHMTLNLPEVPSAEPSASAADAGPPSP